MLKTKTVTITADGRDKGKTFLLTEMPAFQAEAWAARALLALAKSGADIPDDIANSGLAGMASLSIKAFAGVPWYDAKPLLDEMFECVQIQEPAMVRAVSPNDIEDVRTILLLRSEVLELHTGFSVGGWLSGLVSRMTEETTSNTPTSPRRSARSSRRAKQA